MQKTALYSFCILALTLLTQRASAQEFIELNVSPNFSSRILSSSDSYLQDSLNSADKIRPSVSYGVSASFNLNKSLVLTTGLRYSDYGFTRVWYDLKFHDVVHPEIGRIEDLSETVQKNAFYYHKFKYLDIPIRLNYQISKKSHNQDYRIYIHGGLINHIYLEEQMKVFFKGFSVGGERTYRNISTGYEFRPYNVSLATGARFVLRIAPDVWISAQPEFNIPLLHNNVNGSADFRLIQLAGNFGIAKALP